MEIVYRKALEWSVDGRHFRFVADDHVGEFRTPEGEIVTLCMEEWRALADAIGLSYSAKTKPTIAQIMSSDIPNAGQPWSRELDERLESLWNSGTSVDELARGFGRTSGAISSRLMRLGLVTNREEAFAKNGKALEIE